MKQAIKITLIILLTSLFANAQEIEITPQYGYQIGSKYSYKGGYIKLSSSDQYGITASMSMGSDILVEFYWVHQNTNVKIKDIIFYPIETTVSDIKINHYQLGAIHEFGDDKAIPFAGLSAGWSTFNPDDNSFNSETKFTIGITGGLKYFFSSNIGFRLQTQLLMPINWGGVYVGSGGAGVSAGSTIVQLNFSGGLIFSFGDY